MTGNQQTNESERDEFLRMLAELPTIPAHDPDRFETTDGLDNPKCTNGDRALFAAEALMSFQKACHMVEDVETAASDLICDLLHLLHANNRDLLSVLRIGISDFLYEAGCLEDQ
jgi:hypothetical protein